MYTVACRDISWAFAVAADSNLSSTLWPRSLLNEAHDESPLCLLFPYNSSIIFLLEQQYYPEVKDKLLFVLRVQAAMMMQCSGNRLHCVLESNQIFRAPIMSATCLRQPMNVSIVSNKANRVHLLSIVGMLRFLSSTQLIEAIKETMLQWSHNRLLGITGRRLRFQTSLALMRMHAKA